MKTEVKKQPGCESLPAANLYEQAQGGCAASLDRLLKKHEPLVIYAVKRQNLGDLPFEEAVQAGRIGLWHALLRYDPTRGYRLATYAYPAIVREVWAAVKAHCVANKRAHRAREWGLFFQPWVLGPAEACAQAEVRASLHHMVQRLPARLRLVVTAYYGLTGARPQLQREIGAHLGVTKQRVHQMKTEALVRLRQPAHSQELRALLRRHSQREYAWAEEMAQAWLRRRGGQRG